MSPSIGSSPGGAWDDWIFYCDLCGERGEKTRKLIKRQKERVGGVFCSRECSREYRKREKGRWNCFICGESLLWNDRYDLCSDECENMSNDRWYHHGQRTIEYSFAVQGEELPFEGAIWEEQREAALERDGYECQRCGMDEKSHFAEYHQQLHVHHIRRRRTFSNAEDAHSLENLITLCAICHGSAENTSDSEKEQKRGTP